MKIIIFALPGIGDALMFSPALRLLRRHLPQARIELLAMFKGVAELYERSPDVDKVYFRDFLSTNPFASLLFLLQLRRERFDVSFTVYPSNRWPYSAISFLVGAKRRIGHDYNHTNVRSLNFLNNVRAREDDSLHNVEENKRLVQLVGVNSAEETPALTVVLNEKDESIGKEWMQGNRISSTDLLVGYHTGSAPFKNHKHKRWPADRFGELGKRLAERENAKVLLFGGPEEYAMNESIARIIGPNGIVVKTPTLMGSVAVMKACKVFVTNDSGLMHIATGLQLPTVAVFAYTNPAKTSPWRTRSRLIRRDIECSPCFYFSPRPATCIWKEDKWQCITRIEVDEVYAAVREMINRPSTNILSS